MLSYHAGCIGSNGYAQKFAEVLSSQFQPNDSKIVKGTLVPAIEAFIYHANTAHQ